MESGISSLESAVWILELAVWSLQSRVCSLESAVWKSATGPSWSPVWSLQSGSLQSLDWRPRILELATCAEFSLESGVCSLQSGLCSLVSGVGSLESAV